MASSASQVDLPYFEAILRFVRETQHVDHPVIHAHWGCWDDPQWERDLLANHQKAGDRMCHKLFETLPIQSGQRILDVGCGLGATIELLDREFDAMDLVGLNIDQRQLELARKHVLPRGDNAIRFVEGDACQLPFEDDSFDIVLAVEVTPHFTSRRRFLEEVHRVVRPGGWFGTCEFFRRWPIRRPDRLRVDPFLFGTNQGSWPFFQFEEVAREAGFQRIAHEDVTAHVIPGGRAMRELAARHMHGWNRWRGKFLGLGAAGLIRTGIFRYKAVAYQTIPTGTTSISAATAATV